MVKHFDRVQVVTTTTGTSDIDLGSPVDGFQSFPDGGAVNGDICRYILLNLPAWEIGSGAYDSATGKIARTTIDASTNSNAKIVLTGTDQLVFSDVSALDLIQIDDVANSGADKTWSIDKIVAELAAASSNLPQTLTHTSGVITLDVTTARTNKFIADKYTTGHPFVTDSMSVIEEADIPLFGGVEQDDIIALFLMTAFGGSAPAGYTEVRDSINSVPRVWVGFKRMGATPDTSIDLTGTNATQAIVVGVRGVNATTAEDVAHAVALSTTGAPNANDIDPITSDCLCIAALFEVEDIRGGTVSNMSLVREMVKDGQTDMISVWQHDLPSGAVFDPAAYSNTATSPDWKATTQAFRSDGTSGGLKDYTLNFTNIPASGAGDVILELDITIKDAGGVWVLPSIWRDVGTPVPLTTVGRHISRLTVRNNEILSEYIGTVN